MVCWKTTQVPADLVRALHHFRGHYEGCNKSSSLARDPQFWDIPWCCCKGWWGMLYGHQVLPRMMSNMSSTYVRDPLCNVSRNHSDQRLVTVSSGHWVRGNHFVTTCLLNGRVLKLQQLKADLVRALHRIHGHYHEGWNKSSSLAWKRKSTWKCWLETTALCLFFSVSVWKGKAADLQKGGRKEIQAH